MEDKHKGQEFFDSRKRIKEICDAVARDPSTGLPIIKADNSTFYSIMRCFVCELKVNNLTYDIKLLPSRWVCNNMNKRLIPDEVLNTITKIHNDFTRAYAEERIIRSQMAIVERARLNAEYYQKNKGLIRKRMNEYHKALPAQVESRINEIYKLMMKNTPRSEIIEYITTTYQLTTRRANQLIVATQDRLKELIVDERKHMKDKHHAQLMDLYNQAVNDNNISEAHRIIITLNKMYALNDVETKKLEINSKVLKFNFDLGKSDEVDETKYTKMDFQDVEFDESSDRLLNDPQDNIDDEFLNEES